FVLMIAGGLWCALWSTRWRLLGVVPIAVGLMLAPTLRRPDVLIGRGGGLVAVRTETGQLSAVGARGGRYELWRWLAHGVGGRPAAEATRGAAFRCDPQGCTAHVKGRLLAVANAPAALRDDCSMAAILVLRFPRPRGCNASGLVIDADDIRRGGGQALFVEAG